MMHRTGILAKILCVLMILTMLPLNVSAAADPSAVRVTFATAEGVSVRVSTADSPDSPVLQQADGTYLLPPGDYVYTAVADGHGPLTGLLAVTGEYPDLTLFLPLDTRPADPLPDAGASPAAGTVPQQSAVASAVPGFGSEVTKENALAILKAYDSDGYYLVDYVLQKGDDGISYYLSGHSSNAEGLDTVVHESYHGYSHYKFGYTHEAIYVGDKADIDVNMDHPGVDVFPTSTWAETLPSELRTFRFKTYVSASATVTANVYGPYGLINEFTAYCWGMHDQLALFPYYKAQGNNPDAWFAFVNECTNDRQAYSEFRFWTLGYLAYAKANNKAVYDHFMSNQDFLDAYLSTKYRFEAQIGEMDARIDEIIALCKADGIDARISGGFFWIGSHGIGMNATDYNTMITEAAKSKYQKIENEIIEKGHVVAVPDPPKNVRVSNVPAGVSVQWNEVDGATKYKVHRKEEGGSWKAVKTVSGTSWTDKTALMGTTYSYRVSAYNGFKWSDYSSAKKILFNPFTDVASEGAAFKYISWAYNNDIVKGTGDGSTFTPSGNCSRLQFVMMLWKMHGSPEVSGTNPFSDVTGAKATKAILWALKKKVIVAGDSFDPDGNITRLQIVMILWKMAGSPNVGGENPFEDVTGSKAVKAVLWAKEKGITKGTGETTFSPDNACTRQQLVTFLYKYNQVYKVIK